MTDQRHSGEPETPQTEAGRELAESMTHNATDDAIALGSPISPERVLDLLAYHQSLVVAVEREAAAAPGAGLDVERHEAAWQALVDDLHAEFDQGHLKVAAIIGRHRYAIEREALATLGVGLDVERLALALPWSFSGTWAHIHREDIPAVAAEYQRLGATPDPGPEPPK